MTTDINSILNPHLPNGGNSKPAEKPVAIPIDAVDQLADELVKEYSNPSFRRWYCGVIYEFGIAKVHEWRKRAVEGDVPAKLFSAYVKQARTYKKRF